MKRSSLPARSELPMKHPAAGAIGEAMTVPRFAERWSVEHRSGSRSSTK